jgi:Sugar kinases, ribokinase family
MGRPDRAVIGSSAVIFACGAARLGLRMAMVGVVGDDALGRFIVSAMAERGVDPSDVIVDPAVPTGASVHLSGPSDRAILTAAGTMPLLTVAQVPPRSIRRARHVHVSSVFLLDAARPDLPGLLRSVRAGGGTTSVDCNWDPRETWDGGLRAILAETDVFLPNAVEAALITGIDDVAEAARALVALGPRIVAVKLGEDGALVATATGELIRVPALPVEPLETTGAGDSFDAGFLAGWLEGRSLVDCLSLGAVCGALSTRGIGGTATQPTMDEAMAALEGWSR